MQLKIKPCIVYFLTFLPLLVFSQERISLDSKKQLFNDNWKFAKEEFKDASPTSFDDKNWRNVTLPHDWSIDGPFAEEFSPRSGGLPTYGLGWYRKYVTMPVAAKGKQVLLHFDGAMDNAEVWVNGKKAGERPYGYSSFAVDISTFLKYDNTKNVIAVKLSPKEESSRWYAGAGIYRNVWLEINNTTHIAHWGTFITTPQYNDAKATVKVKIDIENTAFVSSNAVVEVSIQDKNGKTVANGSANIALTQGSTKGIEQNLTVNNPTLWDMDNPYLYKLVVKVKRKNVVIDEEITPFGIRTIQFTAKEGFLLNGKKRKLKGVCMHSDLGPLGAVVNRRGLQRQMEIMKSMGVNALRTSHNPPSPEQLDICDELGIVVIDEAFDCWEMPKIKNDYSNFFKEWHEKDLRDMIRRDRNHPSVIMWSIGNEILEQSTKTRGAEVARALCRIVKSEDTTRPTTAGFNYYPASVDNKLAHEVDIKGFNYKPVKYAEIAKNHPDWIIMGSETESVVSSRGVYHLPIEKYQKHATRQVTSYDLVGPQWAYPPDIEFRYQEENPNVVGEFVWTGFDYLGEPTPYGGKDNVTKGGWKGDWVARSSYFGIVDLVGFPKDRFFLYQSQWTTKPMIHLLPHWNWQGMEGKTIPVYCYTNYDEAELFLNGKSLGKKTIGKDRTSLLIAFNNWIEGNYESPYRLSWDVPYEAGSLKVVGYKNGQQILTEEIKTADKPAKITLTPDRTELTADGYDLSYITVKIEDKDGNICPTADNLVRFAVDGAGEFAAVDNGNAATTLLFNEPYRPAFNGLCMLIVRSKKGVVGEIKIQAKSEGLQGATTTVLVKK